MRLADTLLHVAVLSASAAVGSACSSSPQPTQESPNAPHCSPDATVLVTAAQACQLLNGQDPTISPALTTTCAQLCLGTGVGCGLPESFVAEVKSLNPGAGKGFGLDCPTSPAVLPLTCSTPCGS